MLNRTILALCLSLMLATPLQGCAFAGAFIGARIGQAIRGHSSRTTCVTSGNTQTCTTVTP